MGAAVYTALTWFCLQEIHCVDYKSPQVLIKGFVSLNSVHNKQTQFICKTVYIATGKGNFKQKLTYLPLDINRRSITSSDLHRQINQLFDRSSFAKRAEIAARQTDRETSPGPNPFIRKTESPRKHVNRYPMFCLCLTVSNDKVEFGLEPDKQVSHVQVGFSEGLDFN